jgi:DNA-binding transcriptional ArsR family regulator
MKPGQRMSGDDPVYKAILEYLRSHGKSCVKDVAKGIKLSPPTTSKYLLVLLGEKKVKREIKRPYHYYEAV